MPYNPLTAGLPATHPGEILSSVITALFADAHGLDIEQIEAVLEHRAPITAPLAAQLEKATGVRARMWLNLQINYDDKIAVRAAPSSQFVQKGSAEERDG